MLRVLLCDDDELFLNRMKSRVEAFLSSQGEGFEILAHTDTASISDRELELCDLALLDVDLATPEDDGIALARRLRAFRQDAVLIFVTNFIEFAPAGYEVSAFRYVLKRDLEGIFNTYLSQALDRIRLAREVYTVWVDGNQIDLPIKYLERLEVLRHNIEIFLRPIPPETEGRRYQIRGTLSEIEQDLEMSGFLRVHKSYLVNMRFIAKLSSKGVVLDNGTVLRVSQMQYNEIKQKYLLWKQPR